MKCSVVANPSYINTVSSIFLKQTSFFFPPGDTRIVRSYHIQFFGSEAERGWVNEPSLMIFEGKMKFLEMVQQEQTKRKKGKSAYNPFKINISRRHAWNIAVEEAEIAMNLSREERNVQYIFDYIFVNDLIREQQRLKMELQKTGELLKDESPASKLRPGEKRKRVSSERDSVAQNSDKYKRWKLNISTSPVKPFGAESSFDTYYANHRSLVIEQHPDWSTALVFEYLRQKWESEKVRTSKPAKCGSSGTADDSRNSSCVGAPHEHSSGMWYFLVYNPEMSNTLPTFLIQPPLFQEDRDLYYFGLFLQTFETIHKLAHLCFWAQMTASDLKCHQE